jgi:hypothetical protein
MTTKPARFQLDWWVVQKRFIYLLVTLLVLCIVAAGSGLYVWKYGNPFKNVGAPTEVSDGARFISFEGDVRVMRAATRETIVATSDTRLYPGDTVQTQADGRARISMADGSSLFVRPNSTVIIRDNTKSDGESGQLTQVRVAVDNGQVAVRTEDQPDGTSNVIETRQTQNRLAAQTDASFGVNTDNTEEIRIGSGSIETVTRSGEKTTVRGGEYIAVNPAGTVAKREKLLDVPVPVAPHDLAKVSAGANGSVNVYLKWQRPPVGSPSHYRVEVASSPFFVTAGRVIERDQLATTEFNVTDLRPGVYFWRVRATASSGQTSEWSEPLKFIVAQTNKGGSSIEVTDWAVEYIGGNIYIVRGRTQPGTTMHIAGRESLAASDGTFQLQITVADSAREVEVEARDPDGNKSRYNLSLVQGTARARK